MRSKRVSRVREAIENVTKGDVPTQRSRIFSKVDLATMNLGVYGFAGLMLLCLWDTTGPLRDGFSQTVGVGGCHGNSVQVFNHIAGMWGLLGAMLPRTEAVCRK